MPSKKTSFTYELDNDQQELLLGVMLHGNYRKREVPYSLWSIEGDHFNATLYEKEKHGKRKLCVQGSKAEDFILYTLEPRVLGGASLGYETVLNKAYREAVKKKFPILDRDGNPVLDAEGNETYDQYRFGTYGDAMLILKD